jgi:hypothetical protein
MDACATSGHLRVRPHSHGLTAVLFDASRLAQLLEFRLGKPQLAFGVAVVVACNSVSCCESVRFTRGALGVLGASSRTCSPFELSAVTLPLFLPMLFLHCLTGYRS